MSRRTGATNAGEKETSVQPTNNSQEKQAMLLAQDSGHFSMIRALHLADLITEMNGFCGFMSILSSMRYCLGDPQDLSNLWFAFALMPFGLFFDFFDGKVARWRKKSSLMGQELDSLADLVSFGVAPAAAGFAIGFRTGVDQLFLSFYVLCGLTRLARFNVTVAMLPKDKTGKSKYFEGTPIPFACLTTSAIMATWTYTGLIHNSIPLGTALSGTALEFHPVALLFIINGCLMVSKTLHVPKP
ncbi:CDP-diacylglycerol-serine O-phosphatidyltransferase [Exophiala dermatitidis]|uniref:CDP-diacylglycerol--serine O-phosphatidyltransferase n=2 Tax=Exophiala dermatitidis TaxID=5970 RepID=H6BTQ2_EXODN|nr:phosphatidylserine synthase [Exophiala dermatitidis NIH/UT8656]KAJ4504269.1 CDP-diacylglycerol-serine O-phosphatidyltransferase [Exophiala dermatitidis]EHY55479.1 phosphatidylserine synthase [Exophiala dermatitidis NIH/UT8656]KAJ4504650.1 CDP-diacylglycerol-serine O-phosphatidyltransferase [Exophiala dermatitidis]KAJ4533529.1 CDP-diacylglycerol-serine O-phosphatidyltransferase [Exophiala dermatitidis]KAJ4540375.1 CDP-diacylglycerol-serine O-phosphatidyltransferase [Exophiala dermatitidis]